MTPQNTGALSALGRIGMVGTGAVGTTLARSLTACGAQIVAVAARRPEHALALGERLPAGMAQALPAEDVVAACDLIFLAVPDDAIELLAKSLPWHSGQSAVHLSGAKPAAALEVIREHGAMIAALHPLMTFPRVALDDPIATLLERLRGCYWALEAEDAALYQQLAHLVAALDGQVIPLAAASRMPYHIAAVFASNYVVALLAAASALWETFGIERGEALHALLPLLRAAVENLAERGLPQALSGPMARGDAGTVAVHLHWLEQLSQRITPSDQNINDTFVADVELVPDLYRLLARLSLALAVEKQTITPEQVAAMQALLNQH